MEPGFRDAATMPISRSRKHPTKRRARVRPHNPLALDRLFDGIVDRAFAPKAPAVLYHYTTMNGAASILRTHQFRATAHDCTNDSAELTSADAAILETAQELRKCNTGVPATVLELFVEGYAGELHVTKVVPVYLACFSAARDDKEQWRKYADNGQGVCLGIRLLPEPPPERAGLGCALVQVDYGEESWRRKITENFASVCSLLSGAIASRKNIELGLSALYRIAAFASISAKHPEWSGEQEYRMVALVHKGAVVEPQIAPSGKRYVALFMRQSGRLLALAEVIVGSNQEADSAVGQVRQFLTDAGYGPDLPEYPQHIAASAVPQAAFG
jgi:hypothetical protein